MKNGGPGLLQDSLISVHSSDVDPEKSRGLIFSVENMENWVVDRPNEVMETSTSVAGKPGRMEVRFVQKPVSFEKPCTGSFPCRAHQSSNR